MQFIDILGIRIAVTDLPKACQAIENWIDQKTKTYVCVAPVSTIIDGQRDQEYRKIVNNSGMTTPDGMPLVWIGKFAGNSDIGRTYGPDLMLSMSELSEKKGYKCFFYGGMPETNTSLVERLKNKFPKLEIVGSISPPYRKCGEIENEDVLQQINKAGPDILWIGLGSPKQDYWMHHHRERLDVPVMIGAGAAFDFISGTKPQAPLWMRRSGLEWLFRLYSEPRRLWRRYLIGNMVFIYLLIKNSFKTSLGHKT